MGSWEIQKEEWDNQPFNTLDPDDLTNKVNKYTRSIQQLEKGLPANELVPQLKEKVEAMRNKVSILVYIIL